MGETWLSPEDYKDVVLQVIACVLGALILGAGGASTLLWRRRQQPRWALRSAYRQAVGEAGLDRPLRARVKAIIHSKEFFEGFVTKTDVSRRRELDQFRKLLAERAPDAAHDIADRYYAAVYDALAKSDHDYCRETARRWERELRDEAARADAALLALKDRDASADVVPARRGAAGSFVIVVSDSHDFARGVTCDAENYFAQLDMPIPTLQPGQLVHVGPTGGDDWEYLLDEAQKQFIEFKAARREVHLVCAAPWLWCFALGVRLQDQYDLVLYHYESHGYHRIWHMSREIKNLKAPRHGKQYEYRICGEPTQPIPKPSRSRDDAVVIAFNIGSHLNNVVQHRNEHYPDVPLWTMRLRDRLNPAKPGDWIHAAADLAYAIDALAAGRGDKHIYLYGDLPAVLGLMVGSAVGPYRRVHLMQFAGGKYYDLMELRPRA